MLGDGSGIVVAFFVVLLFSFDCDRKVEYFSESVARAVRVGCR
jgi:hypothetical protein